METVCCQLCGADDSRILFEGKDFWYGGPGKFPVRQCEACGLIYLNPRPAKNEIGQYYPDSYDPYSPAIEDDPSRWRRLGRRYSMFKRIRFVEARIRGTGKVLDVGCATGNFLDALRRRGWTVYGVETNGKAAAYARTRLGIDVFNGELEQANFPNRYFDLVILWDVLEHIHNPRQTLLEAARITRPGGTLILTLPNPESLEAKIFGPFWAGWDVPRHLSIFSRSAINRLLGETHWQMFELRCITGRLWLLNLSMSHWLAHRIANANVRQLILKLTGSLLLRLLTLPYFMIIERLGKGSIMAVLAKKV